MRMNKALWYKCWCVSERHGSAKMLWLSKHVSAFMVALLNTNMRFQGCWSKFLLLFSKILLGNEKPKKVKYAIKGCTY